MGRAFSLPSSEEQCVARTDDDIYADVFTDDLHCPDLIGGDRTDDDAVVVVVKRLDLGKVAFNFIVDGLVEVGKEDGTLDACASFPFQVFCDMIAYLVALNIIHDEE